MVMAFHKIFGHVFSDSASNGKLVSVVGEECLAG
jgi:hypothetical protein